MYKAGPWLMGIDFCHIFSKDRIYSDSTGEPVNQDWHVRSNTGMMGVIPTWKMMEVIDGPKMKKVRDTIEQDRKKAQARSNVALDSASSNAAPPANDANLTHREDFMRLVDAAGRKPEPKD